MAGTDAIILLVVVLVMIYAVKGTIKHFKGEGACCGGGSGSVPPEEEKELAGPIIGRKVMHISGMHCNNCANRVIRAINRIDGASAKVNLKKKEAIVAYDREIDDEALKEAVEKAGYVVVSVEG